MCGAVGDCYGNGSSGCGCMSLRVFSTIWVVFMVIGTIWELIIGTCFAVAGSYIQDILQQTEALLQTDDPALVFEFFRRLKANLFAVWMALSIITIMRGILDLSAIICWYVGSSKKKMPPMYFFVGVVAFDFFLDFILFIVVISVMKNLLILKLSGAAVFVPIFFYGWRFILGPYFVHVLLSYVNVLSVGGNGMEMKRWKEIQEAKDKAEGKETGGRRTEAQGLLEENSGTAGRSSNTPPREMSAREDDTAMAKV